MISILTIINSVLILWIIYKFSSKFKIFDSTKTIGNKNITKIYPNLQPVHIVNDSKIKDDDIRNVLLSLKDLTIWKIDNFSVTEGSKNSEDLCFLRIESNIKDIKSVELSCIFQIGKIMSLEVQRPIKKYIISPSWDKHPTTDKNIIDQFTIALWPLYKEASEKYNNEKLKEPNKFSKYLSDIVPKNEVRNDKLDKLLNN